MRNPQDRLRALSVRPDVQEYIEALDEAFPDATPESGTDLRLIDEAIGSRKVVKVLKRLQEEASKNILTK